MITSGDEGVENDLRSVEEVSELSLPDGQQLGLGDAHPVLKGQHGLLRQRAVTHLQEGRDARPMKGEKLPLRVERMC